MDLPTYMELPTYKNISVKDILLNKEFYAEELIKNKLIAFKKLNPTIEEHEEMVLNISTIKERNEKVNRKKFYWVIDHAHRDADLPNKLFLDEDTIESYKKWSMHLDIQAVLDQSDNSLDDKVHMQVVSMHMTTFDCDNRFGRTYLLDLTKLYKNCPQEFKDKLIGEYLENHISATGKEFGFDAPPKTKIQTDKYKLAPAILEMELKTEEAKIKNFFSVFSPFRTHPITKETILFWPSYASCIKLHNKSTSWFDELQSWVKDYLDDKNNWYEWTWDVGDVILFDNRCMLHSYTPGFEIGERIFNQIIVGFEEPFYDGAKTA
jgi:hypothetical protein